MLKSLVKSLVIITQLLLSYSITISTFRKLSEIAEESEFEDALLTDGEYSLTSNLAMSQKEMGNNKNVIIDLKGHSIEFNDQVYYHGLHVKEGNSFTLKNTVDSDDPIKINGPQTFCKSTDCSEFDDFSLFLIQGEFKVENTAPSSSIIFGVSEDVEKKPTYIISTNCGSCINNANVTLKGKLELYAIQSELMFASLKISMRSNKTIINYYHSFDNLLINGVDSEIKLGSENTNLTGFFEIGENVEIKGNVKFESREVGLVLENINEVKIQGNNLEISSGLDCLQIIDSYDVDISGIATLTSEGGYGIWISNSNVTFSSGKITINSVNDGIYSKNSYSFISSAELIIKASGSSSYGMSFEKGNEIKINEYVSSEGTNYGFYCLEMSDLLINGVMEIKGKIYGMYINATKTTIQKDITIIATAAATTKKALRGLHHNNEEIYISANLDVQGFTNALYFYQNTAEINGGSSTLLSITSTKSYGIYATYRAAIKIKGKVSITSTKEAIHLTSTCKLQFDNTNIYFKTVSDAEMNINYFTKKNTYINDNSTSCITASTYISCNGNAKTTIYFTCKAYESPLTTITTGTNEKSVELYECIDGNIMNVTTVKYSIFSSKNIKILTTESNAFDLSNTIIPYHTILSITPLSEKLYYDNIITFIIKSKTLIQNAKFINMDTSVQDEELTTSDNTLVYINTTDDACGLITYFYSCSFKRSNTSLDGTYYLKTIINNNTEVTNDNIEIEISKEPIITSLTFIDRTYDVNSFTNTFYLPKELSLNKIIIQLTKEINTNIFDITNNNSITDINPSLNSLDKTQIIVQIPSIINSDVLLNIDQQNDDVNKNKVTLLFFELSSVSPDSINIKNQDENTVTISLVYDLRDNINLIINKIQILKSGTLTVFMSFDYTSFQESYTLSFVIDPNDSTITGDYIIKTEFTDSRFNFINTEKKINFYDPSDLVISSIKLDDFSFLNSQNKLFPKGKLLSTIEVTFGSTLDDGTLSVSGKTCTISDTKLTIEYNENISGDVIISIAYSAITGKVYEFTINAFYLVVDENPKKIFLKESEDTQVQVSYNYKWDQITKISLYSSDYTDFALTNVNGNNYRFTIASTDNLASTYAVYTKLGDTYIFDNSLQLEIYKILSISKIIEDEIEYNYNDTIILPNNYITTNIKIKLNEDAIDSRISIFDSDDNDITFTVSSTDNKEITLFENKQFTSSDTYTILDNKNNDNTVNKLIFKIELVDITSINPDTIFLGYEEKSITITYNLEIPELNKIILVKSEDGISVKEITAANLIKIDDYNYQFNVTKEDNLDGVYKIKTEYKNHYNITSTINIEINKCNEICRECSGTSNYCTSCVNGTLTYVGDETQCIINNNVIEEEKEINAEQFEEEIIEKAEIEEEIKYSEDENEEKETLFKGEFEIAEEKEELYIEEVEVYLKKDDSYEQLKEESIKFNEVKENILENIKEFICEDGEINLDRKNVVEAIRQNGDVFINKNCLTQNNFSISGHKYKEGVLYDNECESRNITKIDLGKCEDILKNHYPNVADLYIVQVDDYFTNSTNNLNFEVFSEKGVLLDLSVCDETDLLVYSPIPDSIWDFKYIDNKSLYFNDKCVRYDDTYESIKVDMTLNDRRNENFINISLCENGCIYKGIEYSLSSAICECPMSLYLNKNKSSVEIINKVYSAFNNKIKESVFSVLSCYKLVFNFNYMKTNAASFLFLIFLIIILVNLILYFKNKIFIFAKFIFNEYQINTQSPTKKNKNSIDEINTQSTLSKRKSSTIAQNTSKDQNNILKEDQNNILKEDKIIQTNKKMLYPIRTLFIFNDLMRIKSKANRSAFFDFESFIFKNKNKSFFELYKENLKSFQPIMRLIFRKKEDILPVLLSSFIFKIGTLFTANVLFYNSSFINHYYKNKNEYDIGYNIKNIILAYLISTIIGLLINLITIDLSYYDGIDEKKKFRQKLNRYNYNSFNRKIYSLVLQKVFTAYSIILIILYAFYWYFCSAFIAVYPNKVIIWIIDSLISVALWMIIPLISGILSSLLMGVSIKKSNKVLFYIAKIIDAI